MATSRAYMAFILDQLSGLDGITSRMMMGEYIIYYKGRIAAYVCDDRLLVKPVSSAKSMLPFARMESPYEGAREMLLVEEVDDRQLLETLFEVMFEELPEPKGKKPRKKV